MTFTSRTQPYCRYCGGAIRKATRATWFGRSEREISEANAAHWITMRTERPATRVEAQRYVNGKIISSKRSHDREYLSEVGTWDGESYVDEFFCSDAHARLFGYAAAQHNSGLAMQAWHDRQRKG